MNVASGLAGATARFNPSPITMASEDDLRRKFSEIDSDGSGEIDKDEFKSLVKELLDRGAPKDSKLDKLFDEGHLTPVPLVALPHTIHSLHQTPTSRPGRERECGF